MSSQMWVPELPETQYAPHIEEDPSCWGAPQFLASLVYLLPFSCKSVSSLFLLALFRTEQTGVFLPVHNMAHNQIKFLTKGLC